MSINTLYWFLGTFLVIYIFYLIFYVIKKKEYDENKVPVELVYLIRKYHLDMKKINYRRLMNQIGIISSFDIAFTGTFIFTYIKNTFLSIVLGTLMLIPLIIITFSYIGIYYKKKGLVINGNKKN